MCQTGELNQKSNRDGLKNAISYSDGHAGFENVAKLHLNIYILNPRKDIFEVESWC